jgi:protein-S-isoprenylcysteine O-methyltransferase
MLSVHSGVAIGVILRSLGGTLSAALQYGGVVAMAVGIVFRFWAIRVLGRHFSVRVAIQPEHRLITSGPYRWLRHPCYTGTLLTVMGVPAALGVWPLTPFAGVLFLVGHSYRIRVEERMMAETFGAAYDSYRRRTWRMVPGW